MSHSRPLTLVATAAAIPFNVLPLAAYGGADNPRLGSPASRLEPARLPDHIDAMYRAAYALCGSRHDAEDLVQETFAKVLKRPRFVRRDRELAYLLRALRRTYSSGYRTNGPKTLPMSDDDARVTSEPSFRAGEIMQAIASAPTPYREAVIAIDLLGMSYKDAARAMRTRSATIASRLHRGRQHVARVLSDGN